MEYCNCKECTECCELLPGIPLPEEVIKIAEFLKMPISECLKKYFIVGWRKIYLNGEDHGVSLRKQMPCMFCNKYTEHEAWQEKSTNPHSGNFGKLIWFYSCIKCNGLRPIPPQSKDSGILGSAI